MLMANFVPNRADYPTEAAWQEALTGQTHPLSEQRLQAAGVGRAPEADDLHGVEAMEGKHADTVVSREVLQFGHDPHASLGSHEGSHLNG